MNNMTEIFKGILEGCVLEIISHDESYGYEITKKLNILGFKDVVEGTVYTILLRLEKSQLVIIKTKRSEVGPMRKFYSLNDAGRRELSSFWSKWNFVSAIINKLNKGDQ